MGWTDELAQALGEAPLTDAEVTRLLAVARDVAHGTERRYAPLSTFLLGLALGRRDPADRVAGLDELAGEVAALLPDETSEA